MKTILVVDDEFDLTSTLQAILEDEGYRTDVCTDGRAALERLKQHSPDMMLMDVMMPVLSGFEVLREMRSRGLDSVPVVLMSSVPPQVQQEDYHWRAFLRKPFTLDALKGIVEQVIGKAGANSAQH